MVLNQDIEKAFIGSLLLSSKKMFEVSEVLSTNDMTDDMAKRAYVIARALWSKKKPVDLITVTSEDMSLAVYLSEATSQGSPFGVVDYAKRIAASAKTHRINSKLTEIATAKTKPSVKLENVLNLYQQEIEVLRKDSSVTAVMDRFEKRVEQTKKKGRLGLSTGFDFLDEMYVYYIPGHIWTMGAYTSVGKTAVMVQKLCNLIVRDKSPSVIVISTEMTEEQLMSRILANFTGIHSFRILSGNFRAGEEEIVEEYKKLIRTKSFYIHDDVYTLSDIEMVFRKADLQGGIDIGFIDYVQNCQVPEAANEYQAGSALAKRLQKLAKDIRCTLICLSQVSNDVGRGNTDQLELKGAGEWAAVSDLGIMLQRSKQDKAMLKYQVKKNRHGALHDHLFEYKADFTRLVPLAAI